MLSLLLLLRVRNIFKSCVCFVLKRFIMKLTLIVGISLLTVASFGAAISFLPSEIDRRTSVNAASIEEIQQLSDQVTDLQKVAATETERSIALRTERDQLQADLTEARGRITTLMAEQETTSRLNDSLNLRVAELENDLTARNEILANQAENAEGLKDRLGELEANLASLQSAQQAPNPVISDLETRLEMATGALESANERIEELTTRVTQEFQARMVANDEIASLKDSVAAQHEVVLAAQNELATIKATDIADRRETATEITMTETASEPPLETALAITPATCNSRMEEVLSAASVEFETGTAVLASETGPLLKDLSAIARDCAEVSLLVEIGGHTDNLGNDAVNLALSEDRARAIYAFFAEAGIPQEAMRPVGFGESQPIAENNTSAGRSANRRITFTWQTR
ncbi:OmpA family protein [Yoonia sp. 2307UL14-13]|uniref:OmpA family protein n=1 Tax=Yoonia sp. 2307UL14-13 TaxID=3126506 RepID=UPI0030A173F6